MVPNIEKVVIKSEFITLGQFLHFAGIVDTGGAAKAYLAEAQVIVNGQVEQRRGRKLRSGDTLLVGGRAFTVERG